MINMDEKTKRDIKEYEGYAKKNGFRLNPSKKIVVEIIRGLIANEEEFGKRYCPCRKVTGIPDEDKKIQCPCIYHKKEIKEQGSCYCLLFVR